MYKTHQVRNTFGSWDVEKVPAILARSTFPSENVPKKTRFGPLLEVEMSKKCMPLWREAHFQVKMHKTHQIRSTFRSCDVEKVHVVVARSTFRSQNVNVVARSTFRRQNVKNTRGSDHFWRFRCRFAWQKGLCTLSRVSKTWGFCSIYKTDGRRGTFEEDLQKCIFRGRCSARDMFIRAVRRSGRWFPEKGCILEHQIFRFAEMTLRDRCSTSYDMASLFRGRRSTLDRWNGKIAKCIGTRPSALHSTFHFWRKSRRIVSFLMLSNSKLEEVSIIASFFGCCKLKNWESRRIATFSSLQLDRQTYKQTQTDTDRHRQTQTDTDRQDRPDRTDPTDRTDRADRPGRTDRTKGQTGQTGQTDTQTHRHTDTQTHRQTDRQTDRQPDSQTNRQTDR